MGQIPLFRAPTPRCAFPQRHWAQLQFNVCLLFDPLEDVSSQRPGITTADAHCCHTQVTSNSINIESKYWFNRSMRARIWARGLHISGSQRGWFEDMILPPTAAAQAYAIFLIPLLPLYFLSCPSPQFCLHLRPPPSCL